MRTAIYIPAICMLFLVACSTTKSVPEGDQLYTGSKIEWKGKKLKDFSELEDGMESKIYPKPNRRFLGMPIKLWLYNLGKKPTGKGLNYLLREKWGEAPVLYSKVKPEFTSLLLKAYTEDNSYFQSRVEYHKKDESKKKASMKYTVYPGTSYIINSVEYELDSSALSNVIRSTKRRSLLTIGKPYRLENIIAERERVHITLKNRGYYYFTPDYLLVQVDTNHNGKVNLFLQVKPETPSSARYAYKMDNVIIYPGYSLQRDSIIRSSPEQDMGSYKIVDPDKLFKETVFKRIILLKEDSIYRLRWHNNTLQRLMSMGNFKFVKAQFSTGLDSSLLNARFYVTPNPQYGLQLQLTGNSKSNNYIGSVVELVSLNRNWLRRANRLEFKLSAGYDWQVGGKKDNQTNTNGYNLEARVAVIMPKIYVPLLWLDPKSPFVPKTRISLGYELLSRPGLYNLNSLNTELSYLWQESRFVNHIASPLSITYVKPSKITPEFQKILENDFTLQQSLQKQFIIGGNYTYIFNNQISRKRNSFFITANADFAGNLLGLLVKSNDSGQKQIIHNTFSQYVRLYADARYYMNLDKRFTWVNRLYLGYGYSYGNSYSLPFVKQFFIGGSNSLRAFRARTLGPGSYLSPTSSYAANEAGDIKLEFNSELRIKLVSIFQAAIFTDAGNIWLQRKTEGKPGAEFEWGKVLEETAVGAGVGIRVDASILIVRFDVAMPLRKPWLPMDSRWVIKDIDFGNSDWRKENLVLNIAIGFPF
jgi:outer membrane protein assembly factor BamA